MIVAECHMVSGSTKSNYTVLPQILFLLFYFTYAVTVISLYVEN